ncbi:MAG TPA: GH36 C-terminal domain-containing protein, partial [Terriglobales bacterium]|nr:GH36 C-terminal domain-containing protein [Terriglobales bacterium]
IRSGVELYKKKLRPIMRGSRVYHHTPLTEYYTQTPWVVLEYATPDAQRAMATLFRTSNFEDPVYRFVPRGLDASRTYAVTFKNRGYTVEMSGLKLMQEGVAIRLETAGTSEMLLFSSEAPATKGQ